jgi:hypothetical protein
LPKASETAGRESEKRNGWLPIGWALAVPKMARAHKLPGFWTTIRAKKVTRTGLRAERGPAAAARCPAVQPGNTRRQSELELEERKRRLQDAKFGFVLLGLSKWNAKRFAILIGRPSISCEMAVLFIRSHPNFANTTKWAQKQAATECRCHRHRRSCPTPWPGSSSHPRHFPHHRPPGPR